MNCRFSCWSGDFGTLQERKTESDDLNLIEYIFLAMFSAHIVTVYDVMFALLCRL